VTLAVQVSAKTNAGTIFVIGGNNVDEFRTNLLALYAGPDDDPAAAEEAAEEILQAMAQALSPMGAGVQAIQNAMPGTTVQQYPQGGYAPQGPPQPQYGGNVGSMGSPPRTAQYDTFLNVPFADKDTVKQFGARWDKDRRQWKVPAGVDLNPFARWGV
jgi:uncharacterized protein DUF5710